MEELHRQGGVPHGWRLRLPMGDPQAGKDIFKKLECYTCHTVKGEGFPKTESTSGQQNGPDLTEMGRHHPEEYLFESVIFPNRVIVEGPGYTGTDGLSIIPSYNDTLTVQEALDLAAYIKSLGGKIPHGSHDMKEHHMGDDRKKEHAH